MFKRNQSIKSMQSAGTAMIVLFMLIFSACSDLNLDNAEGEGTMNFYFAESPEASKAVQSDNDDEAENRPTIGNIEEVNLDVLQVRVKLIPNPADTLDPEPNGSWHDIPVEPFVVNLLDLSDADTLIAEADLPEGFYSEIRLVLSNDNEIVVDGETHDLMVPSGSASGYKIKFNQTLHSGQEMDVTLEFDAESSIHVTGNGRYMLQPVLRVFNGRSNGNG
jgi:hypothetical protein